MEPHLGRRSYDTDAATLVQAAVNFCEFGTGGLLRQGQAVISSLRAEGLRLHDPGWIGKKQWFQHHAARLFGAHLLVGGIQGGIVASVPAGGKDTTFGNRSTPVFRLVSILNCMRNGVEGEYRSH